jgi:hypothetical protein
MCDYSLHAVASRPAQVGETLITTTFPRTTTRGFASASEPEIAVCMLPGTELAFAGDVKYQSQWLWPKVIESRVGKFSVLDPQLPYRHHDAVEFPDGSRVLVTKLMAGQRVTVLQLPVTSHNSKPAPKERGAVGTPENAPLPA